MSENQKEKEKPEVKKIISPTVGVRISEGAKPNNTKAREKATENNK